jgi:hypothetical protein
MSFPLRLIGIALLLLAVIAITCRNQAAAAPNALVAALSKPDAAEARLRDPAPHRADARQAGRAPAR